MRLATPRESEHEWAARQLVCGDAVRFLRGDAMRVLLVFGLVLLGAGSGVAQTDVSPNGSIIIREGTSFESVSMLDTGVKRAYAGQPFSAKFTTTEVFNPRNGKTDTHVLVERHFRDAEGRERFEQGVDRSGTFQLGTVRLADPVAGYSAMLLVRDKVARVTHYTPVPYNAANAKRSAELKAEGDAERAARADAPLLEKLPEKMIAGVRAEGLRETYTIPIGREGNDQEVRIVVEIWTSPELKIVVGSSLDDPRSRKQTMVMTELVRSDPDPKLFRIPAD
jgi:hypothetical protein